MALLFMDGFDHYTNSANMELKWPIIGRGSVIPGQTGRFGGFSVGLNDGGGAGIEVGRSLPSNVSTMFVGFAFKWAGGASIYFGPVLYDGTAGGPQIGFHITSSGVVTVVLGAYNNNATIGTLSGTYNANQWYYLEIEVVFSTSATGSVIVHAGGTQVLNVTSVQTAQTANAYANQIWLYATSLSVWIDDLYVCDNTGAQNNTFLGERKVVTVFPSAAGRVDQWATQVGGTTSQPWTAVNETNPDGDTSYIADNTVGDIEDFALGSFGTVTSLAGVQINVDMRKDDVSTHTIGVGVGNGTTENFDAGTTVLSTYSMVSRTLDSNPLTSAAWATSDLTGLQASIKTIA